MPLYDVFQQRHPIKTTREAANMSGTGKTQWEVNIVHVGVVDAASSSDAIDRARELSSFRIASRKSLGAFPMVSPVEQ